MSDQSSAPLATGLSAQVRTLAVRISEDLRAQLDLIAQLNDRSVTEEIRIGLEDWIERSKSDPKVLQRADTVRAEIEREAETRRGAIEAIFSGSESKPKASGTRAAASSSSS